MTLIRLDPSDPADLRRLIESGVVWLPTVPLRYRQMALDAIADGEIAPNHLIPGPVLDEIDERRRLAGQPPLR